MSKFSKDDLYGYKIKLYKLSEEQGGGWGAEAVELPGCFADGKTPDEAINDLKEVIDEWFDILEQDGKPVPSPIRIRDNALYSGKFTVRVSKSLHRLLAERAEEEGVSLNQLVNSLLAYNLGMLVK
jgi:antitoxin HicB